MDLPTTRYSNPGYEPAPEVKKVENTNEKVEKVSKLEKISVFIFIATILLAPLAFIPSVYAPLDVVKITVLSMGILISCLLYVIDSIKRRTLVLPHYALAYTAIALVVSIIISTFLSTSPTKSFLGQGFEVGTASFIFLMFLSAYFLSRLVVKNKERILTVYAAILVAFVLLALFHIVRILGGADFMTLGILPSLASTIVGKWFDLSILSGLVVLLTFFGIKFLPLGKGLKWLLYILLVVSGFLVFATNFSIVWTSLVLILLAIGIYEFVSRPATGTGLKKIWSKISIFTLIVLIIAILGMWKGNGIASSVVSAIKLDQTEIVLPWQLTLDVASNTFKERPLFGSGPNRFDTQFFRFKPFELNQTPFFNTEFTKAFGTLPTFAITQGLVGMILWILFLIFFVRDGVRALKRANDPTKKFFITSSFFTASFLWFVNIIYIPSHVIIFFTFIFTGLFVGLLLEEGVLKEKEVGIIPGSRMRKYAPAVLSIISLILILWPATYLQKIISIYHFQGGIKELNVLKNTENAEMKFAKALSWSKSDIYYQALAEIDILKINALVQQIEGDLAKNPESTPDQVKVAEIGKLMEEALKNTRSAIAFDPYDYYNYLSEARVSEMGAALKIKNAYENAQNAYANSLQVNPLSPATYLNLARLEASQGKYREAQQYIGRALQLKSNYLDAVFLLSQIQVSNGQLKDAIVSSQVATQINPNDPLLFFQLGILQYDDKDYANAVISLEKAVSLSSQYANARYFLGLSYVRVGRNSDAILQFEELAKTNPDNKEVAFILSNLKAGKSPFSDAKPPIDSKPEKRKTLPVNEKTEPAPKAKTAK